MTGCLKWKIDSVKIYKKDLVIRISNWMKDKDEPAYDVEIYNRGTYNENESKPFPLSSGLTKNQAKFQAIKFACMQIKKLLK